MALKNIKNIPQEIPIQKGIQVRGTIYYIEERPGRTENESEEHVKKKHQSEYLQQFCAFQILNCNLNQSTQLVELKKLGFKVPPTEFTRFSTNEVNLYRKLWLRGKLFENYPTNGIVLKVNSRKLQKQLGENSSTQNWAHSIKTNKINEGQNQ